MAVKDALGNELKVGDLVHVSLGNPPVWEVGKITEIKPGGAIVPLSRDKAGMMMGQIRITIDATSMFDPSKPQVTDVIKLHKEVKIGEPTDR